MTIFISIDISSPFDMDGRSYHIT